MNALRSHVAFRVFGALALGDLTAPQLERMLGVGRSHVQYALTVLGKRGMVIPRGCVRRRRGRSPHLWHRLGGEGLTECRYRPEGVGK